MLLQEEGATGAAGKIEVAEGLRITKLWEKAPACL
jgi:hypothetical protein